MHIEVARAGAPPPATSSAGAGSHLIKWHSPSPSPSSPTTSRRKKKEMGACATKPKVLEEGVNAPETREMVEAGEEWESKSRQSLEILLKEVGNESETKENAIVKVKQSVQVVEQAER